MKTKKFLSISLLVSLVLSACLPLTVTQGPTSSIPTLEAGTVSGLTVTATQSTVIPTSQAPSGSISPTEAQAAVEAAMKSLAAQLGIDVSVIKVTSIEAVDWPDGCLGAGKPNEMCLMVITPGYRIVLEANAVSYEYHTDLQGNTVRQAAGGGQNLASAVVVFAARQFLAKTLNISLGSIMVVSSEIFSWPDTCLGVPSGKACVLVLTPGYKIVLAAGGKQYEVHTDATGSDIILAPAAPSSQVPSIT